MRWGIDLVGDLLLFERGVVLDRVGWDWRSTRQSLGEAFALLWEALGVVFFVSTFALFDELDDIHC